MSFIATLFFPPLLKYLLLQSALLKSALISSLPWARSGLWFPSSLLDKGICVGNTVWVPFQVPGTLFASWFLRAFAGLQKSTGFFPLLFHSFPSFTSQAGSSFSLFCRYFSVANTETPSMYSLFPFEVTSRIVKHFFSWIVVLGMVIPFISEVHRIISTNKMSGRQSFVSNNQSDKLQINSCTKKVLNCEIHR